jgi:hypothetical protein
MTTDYDNEIFDYTNYPTTPKNSRIISSYTEGRVRKEIRDAFLAGIDWGTQYGDCMIPNNEETEREIETNQNQLINQIILFTLSDLAVSAQ